ncbi:hypothetical protein CTI12_AA362500 [Artemisia annua]|uniref:Uncharacterized protein n=1 Tax=Artemisia annua TaxID=35608 RepID=A0A2U1MLR1_ARTAN|nr:hypothetical protein CTI12_AA362500 [Artemisia annua]
MAQDLELDFEKYCVVDGSPKTVLLSPRNSKVEKRKVRRKTKTGNEVLLSQNKEFTEISLRRYRSASCRDVRSTRMGVDKAHKRGSVYQSSNEVDKMNKISEKEVQRRKKIEFSRSGDPIPFEIFDSLCSDEDDAPLASFSSSFVKMSLNSISKQEDQESSSIHLPKSLSSRLEQPHSPTKSENDSSKANSPKSHLTPFKKMFDPFMKSKPQKSPISMSKNTVVREPLIHNSSNGKKDANFIKKDSCSSIVSSSPSSCSSPAHLNGVLKLRNKNRLPYFEFLVKNPNDVLVAKTHRLENDCNWVYTFHTTVNKQKINASGQRLKDVGQMRVSCYLCTELVNADNSMVTEFVLYDLAHSRKSGSPIPQKTPVSKESTGQSKVHVEQKFVAGLHPDLETAAIVIQFPTEKIESLKCNQGDMKSDDLFKFSQMKLEKSEPTKVRIVIPSGNHSLPCDESHGPSPLLDRWRLGGGCDCGGWDMGCPLIVLGNSNVQKDKARKLPVELFLQGTKEDTPALTMKMTVDGQYAVDFHARLTSLQAFSICVAILHSTESSDIVDQNNDRERLQCDSMRVFAEDEVKHLIEVMADEDKRKPSKNDIPPSFLVNPPFSPMSRA